MFGFDNSSVVFGTVLREVGGREQRGEDRSGFHTYAVSMLYMGVSL